MEIIRDHSREHEVKNSKSDRTLRAINVSGTVIRSDSIDGFVSTGEVAS